MKSKLGTAADSSQCVSDDAGFLGDYGKAGSTVWQEIGRYLVENVIAHNNKSVTGPSEYRVLGDSPAIGVMLYEDCGRWQWKPAPRI